MQRARSSPRVSGAPLGRVASRRGLATRARRPHKHTTSMTRLVRPQTNTLSRRAKADQIDRSGLKSIASTPKTISQLETLQELRKSSKKPSMREEIEAQEARENQRAERRGESPWWANKEAWKSRLNALDLKQRQELDQAANIKPPSQHPMRPSTSPYFLPLWDPELRTPQLIESFETSANMSIDQMDLVGSTLLGEQVNVRQLLINPNTVSLVAVLSTNEPLNFTAPLIDIWSTQVKQIQESNHLGAIQCQPVIISISEGRIYNFFRKQINRNLYTKHSGNVADSIVSLHISDENDAVSRARRFLDCRNRFVSNIFLVDSRGTIRWRSALATEPSPEFVETVLSVTNDLVTELTFENDANQEEE